MKKSSTYEIQGVDDMKNIYKRKDGRYEFSMIINQKRIDKSSKNLKELERIARSIIRNGKEEKINNTNFKNIAEEWFNIFKAPFIQDKSHQNYKLSFNNYLFPAFAKKNINTITFKELQTFINNIDKRRIAEIVTQHLKGIFNYAYSNRYIRMNPTTALKLPKKTQTKIIKPLTLEEQSKFLNHVKGHKLESFILFSLIFGTRRNETLAFKLEDFNIEKQTVTINCTKTENAPRYIKVSKTMIDYLLKHNCTIPYFNFTSDYVSKQITKLLKELNINKSLHSLRHTTATNLFYLGYQDKERQQYLGHANIITTNNIYTYLENDITKENIHNLYNDLYFEK